MPESNLIDAIRVVKENERLASESYASAANDLKNPLARELFKQLSGFEKYHLEMISNLEKSLLESGMYIQYESQQFPLPPLFEIKAAEEPDKKSAMQVISEARDLEQQAEKAYTTLAVQIPDQQGKDMFTKLAGDEKKHYQILTDVYWSLNNTGKWQLARPK
jgi:rubrerythrin